ncbi:MAG TPA: hypothetical protein VN648_26805, partial [Candidatus Methylomirabilis sp.]|nr:hypothetical protein [Candidatus Methylomirabilis sp.]
TDAAEISVDTSAGDGQDLDVEAVIAGTCDEIKTMDPGSGLTAGSYDIVWTGGDGTVAIHAHAIVDESGEVVDTEIVDAGLDFTAPPAGTYQNAAFEVVIA